MGAAGGARGYTCIPLETENDDVILQAKCLIFFLAPPSLGLTAFGLSINLENFQTFSFLLSTHKTWKIYFSTGNHATENYMCRNE